MFRSPGTVLVLSPHTDDGEFGCGGTMARLVAEGSRVINVAFSAAEQSVPPHLPRDILRTEFAKANAALGLQPDDAIVLDFQVRLFPEHRQRVLDTLLELGRRFKPDVVFLPSASDTHQDHAVIAQEGFRAFKRATMFGYEIPWNNLEFRTSGYFVLSAEHVERKIAAIACYRSQEHRGYANGTFVRSLAITRGTQLGCELAEAFDVVRVINR